MATLLALSGPITIEHTPALAQAHAGRFRQGGAIDLAAVSDVDSTAIALILAWRREAGAQPLQLLNAPASLLSLIRLYGLDDLLLGKAS